VVYEIAMALENMYFYYPSFVNGYLNAVNADFLILIIVLQKVIAVIDRGGI
jgi:hypothetical protein